MKTIILPEAEPAIQILQGESIIVLSRDEAYKLAVRLAFETNGNLVLETANGRIISWNLQSTFLTMYKELFEAQYNGGDK